MLALRPRTGTRCEYGLLRPGRRPRPTGRFLMCRYTLPHLLDGGGSIVNVASNAGLMGQPYSAAYCASKGGVVNLTRLLAVEYVDRV